MRRFARHACIDWSGAATPRQPGIAVAATQDGARLTLLRPDGGWTRQRILGWLETLAEQETDILVGLDLSPALPFIDCGAYFPGWADSPADGPALWHLVDTLAAADPHLSATSFVTHPEARRHFRHGVDRGDLFAGSTGRLRACEHGQAAMGLRPASCFNLVGAAQVGKSSLTGMRVLNRLRGRIPVWPFDPVPERGPCIVEIYTSLAARQSGVTGPKIKILDPPRLSAILSSLGFAAQIPDRLDDHSSDALLTAAWLSRAAGAEGHWRPAAMSPHIARTEGWTFGVI
jgi:hypothetical protein